MALTLPLIFLLLSHFFFPGVEPTSFVMVNKCEYTVWPGLLSNAGVPPLPTTGFVLQKGEEQTIDAPASWGGRFWGRTLCSTGTDGKFSCATGDCGSGTLECSGSGATPPATLAEFTLDGSGGLDFYDVSLVDGYNVPMLVVPQGGSGQNCSSTGCVVDLNGSCPTELRVTSVDGAKQSMGCKSACEAQKSSQDQSPDPKPTSTPAGGSTTWSPADTSMIYEGALDQSKASPSTSHLSLCGITVTLALAFCRMWWLF
ncbi:hypothetical protein HID58_006025 [Brassica napus]|uniref:Uncharacterized protein n=1 Tax=Brassica napus TaxID=3708 RepID=A0ABQ8EA71_BRANA|nr:hypothetical protein HID58_006025 [Brassica napus]